VVCLAACTPGEGEIYWESETQTWRGDQCTPEGECLSASLILPSFPELDPELQDQIDQWISYDTLVSPGSRLFPEDLMEDFILSMDDYDQDIWESPRNHHWYANLDVQVTLAEGNLLCLVRSAETHTGGAHGLERVDFLMVDLEEERLLTLADLVDPRAWEALRRTARPEFLHIHAPFDEFWFPDGEFSLPGSERGIGLSMDGLELSWTLYEIASYAYGVPRMTIPWEEVEDLIRLDGPAGALVAGEE
jgi:hypothetical protein